MKKTLGIGSDEYASNRNLSWELENRNLHIIELQLRCSSAPISWLFVWKVFLPPHPIMLPVYNAPPDMVLISIVDMLILII